MAIGYRFRFLVPVLIIVFSGTPALAQVSVSLDDVLGFHDWPDFVGETITMTIDVSDQLYFGDGFSIWYDFEVYSGLISQCGFPEEMEYGGALSILIQHPDGGGGWIFYLDDVYGAVSWIGDFQTYGSGSHDLGFITAGPFDVEVFLSGAAYVLNMCPIEDPTMQINQLVLRVNGMVPNETTTWDHLKSIFR